MRHKQHLHYALQENVGDISHLYEDALAWGTLLRSKAKATTAHLRANQYGVTSRAGKKWTRVGRKWHNRYLRQYRQLSHRYIIDHTPKSGFYERPSDDLITTVITASYEEIEAMVLSLLESAGIPESWFNPAPSQMELNYNPGMN